MKTTSFILILLVLSRDACCKETEYEGYKHDDTNNLTSDGHSFLSHFKPQQFTPGTLLGLVVATLVVVIGSFLVLWRLCCEVEVVVMRDATEPLNSISQNVSEKRTAKKAKLLAPKCSSSVLEIA